MASHVLSLRAMALAKAVRERSPLWEQCGALPKQHHHSVLHHVLWAILTVKTPGCLLPPDDAHEPPETSVSDEDLRHNRCLHEVKTPCHLSSHSSNYSSAWMLRAQSTPWPGVASERHSNIIQSWSRGHSSKNASLQGVAGEIVLTLHLTLVLNDIATTDYVIEISQQLDLPELTFTIFPFNNTSHLRLLF